MQRYIEMTGRNEEEATGKALRQLGLDRDEVSVEVLERAKSGFLGIGSCPAKVRVTYEAPDEPMPVAKTIMAPIVAPPATPTERSAPKTEPPHKPQVAPKPAPQAPRVAQPTSNKAEGPIGERTEEIVGFLTGLMERMQVNATPAVYISEEGHYKVDLSGEGSGALIGRRGETLDAIQQITSYTINKNHASRVRIHVDCENYRAKREESLVRLAQKVAGKVIKYRRNVTLEPMNAYERHVIHTALQDWNDISTYSTGTEPNRRTVVAYAKEAH